MSRTEIEIDTRHVLAALNAVAELLDDMSPVTLDIGELLLVSTKQRFQQGVSPDGVPWQKNSATTLARKKGTRPLIGETKRLSNEIHYSNDASGVDLGTNLIYAAPNHFGASKGAFGKTKRGGPIPWGNVPARPFFGISDQDEQSILDIVQEHIIAATENASP
jgi:phage virion morphogenesis protein